MIKPFVPSLLYQESHSFWGWALRGGQETIGAASIYVGLHRLGLVAPLPVWVFPAIVGVSFVASKLAEAWWSRACTGWRLYLRVGVGMAGTTAAIYATGWGPALAIGYLFSLADNLRVVGARATRPVLVWVVVGLGVGQGAIAWGVAPTLLPAPAVQGVGVLVGVGLVFALRVMEGAAAAKERVEEELRVREGWFRSLVQNATCSSGYTGVGFMRAPALAWRSAARSSSAMAAASPPRACQAKARPLSSHCRSNSLRETLCTWEIGDDGQGPAPARHRDFSPGSLPQPGLRSRAGLLPDQGQD